MSNTDSTTTASTRYGVARPSSRRPVVILILAMVGILAARFVDPMRIELLLAVCAIGIALWIECRASRHRFVASTCCAALLSMVVILFFATWSLYRYERVAANDLSALVGPEPTVWRVEGRVRTPPVIRTPGTGSLSRFGYEGPSLYFQFKVDHALRNNGDRVPITGSVLVRIEQPYHELNVGDRLQLNGLLRAFAPAHNPGEFDRADLARRQQLAGVLTVKARESVTTINASCVIKYRSNALTLVDRWYWTWIQARSAIRARTAGWLLQDVPQHSQTKREAMLAALLVGERSTALEDLDQSFRRVGLAHLLSISGLHLAVLTGTLVLLLRLFRLPSTTERIIILVVVALYLVVVPARIPVWRAAVMVYGFTIAGFFGRRLEHHNVLALSALVLLIWQPAELMQAGFQLSFGIVFALITLTPTLRRRLFGDDPDFELLSGPEYLYESFKTLVAATLVAWLVSLPLVAHHFGLVSLIAPVATLIALPLALLLLALGYLKCLTALVWPSIGVIIGPILAVCADALIAVTERLEAVPYSSLLVSPPGVIWTVIATLAIGWFMRSPHRLRLSRPVAAQVCVLVVLALWLFKPGWFIAAGRALASHEAQVTMLSVGNGSCYAIESGGDVVLFDAGFGSFTSAADSIIIPALLRLGHTQVHTIIISHADVDHFAAAVEVMEQLGTKRLIVTPHMLDDAEREPLGPEAYLVQNAERLGVSVQTASRGTTMQIGRAQWIWLNPIADHTYERVNDTSAVIRVAFATRVLLLTGDIQDESQQQLLADPTLAPQLACDILELPHHGGWSEHAEQFVQAADPVVILQSTGARRIQRDLWENVLADHRHSKRFVSARCGATTCRVMRDGSITIETWLRPERWNTTISGTTR